MSRLFFCVVILLLAAGLSIPAAACEHAIRVIRNAEFEPDEDDRFLFKVVERAGCRLEIIKSAHRVTLIRRFEMLKAGQVDLLIGASRIAEREEFGTFSIPYRSERIRVWSRPDAASLVQGKSVSQLVNDGWKLIGPAQGWYGGFYETLRKRPGVVIADYKRIQQGVRLLLGKRGDLLVGDELWLARLPDIDRKQLHLLPEVLHEDALYMLYSRKTVPIELMKQLDAAITAVNAEERMFQ